MIDDYFPAKPHFNGEWAPIYFEPIIGSGERITCGIAVVSENEKSLIQTLNQERLKCMFGASSEKIAHLIKLALATIDEHLETNNPIGQWVSPIEGFILGKVSKTNGRMFGDIKRQAITQSSFSLTRAEAEVIADAEIELKIKNERWVTKIKKCVNVLNPTYEKYFNQNIEYGTQKSKVRYGYISGGIVANFSIIVPKKWTVSVEMSKAKLYDLELLGKASYLAIPDIRELIIGVSRNPGEIMSKGTMRRMADTLDFIKGNAKSDGINVFIADNEQIAAEHILEYA